MLLKKILLLAFLIPFCVACQNTTNTNGERADSLTNKTADSTATDNVNHYAPTPDTANSHNATKPDESTLLSNDLARICAKGQKDSVTVDGYRLINFEAQGKLYFMQCTLPSGNVVKFKAFDTPDLKPSVGHKWPVYILNGAVASQTGPCK